MAVGSTFQAILRKLRADYSRQPSQRASVEALEERRLLTISTASIAFESAGVEGSPVRLDLSASTDGTLTGWSVGWGDGNTSDDIPGDATYVDHTYTEEGHYDVSAEVTDSVEDTGGGSYSGSYQGSSSGSVSSYSTSTSVDVGDADLSKGDEVTIAPMMTDEFSGVVGHFLDADSYDDGSDFTATINWDDGSDSTSGTISGHSVSGTHTYATAGTYNITIDVYDPGGKGVELNATANVWKPQLTTAIASDQVDVINEIFATSSNPHPDAYFAQDNSSTLQVELGAIYTSYGSGNAGRLVCWLVSGTGDVNPNSGNFAGTTNPVITVSPSGSNYDFIASFGVDNNADGLLEAGEATLQIYGHGLDITVKTISHNTAGSDLSATGEKTTGAFVPVNNDDDNYDGYADNDLNHNVTVTGEDDLLPITLHHANGGDKGHYTIYSGALKVFTHADRSGPISGDGTISAATDQTLYLEGTTPGVDTLSVTWSNSTQTVYDADHIKVTTFAMSGASDVPGYSIYEYKATGAPSAGHWISGDGTIESGAGTSDVTVLWGSGADVEKAPYYASSDYTWDFEVNVVKVSLRMDLGNTITYPGIFNVAINGATAGTFTLTVTTGSAQTTAPLSFDASAAAVQTALQALSNVGPGNATVTSAGSTYSISFATTIPVIAGILSISSSLAGTTSAPSVSFASPVGQTGTNFIDSVAGGGMAMGASITIDQMAGPVVNGVMRGITFIQVGFIQNVRFSELSGRFSSIGALRQSSLQDGNYHLDVYSGSTVPWYDTLSRSSRPPSVAYYQPPNNNAAISNFATSASDSPNQLASDVASLEFNNQTGDIDYLNIIFDANLYLAVRTTQDVNGSAAIYTQRAKASWEFNGSGDVVADIWTGVAGAGTSGNTSFSQIVSGLRVPVTTGTVANNLLASQTFSTVAI